jgi:hypothetical protein
MYRSNRIEKELLDDDPDVYAPYSDVPARLSLKTQSILSDKHNKSVNTNVASCHVAFTPPRARRTKAQLPPENSFSQKRTTRETRIKTQAFVKIKRSAQKGQLLLGWYNRVQNVRTT